MIVHIACDTKGKDDEGMKKISRNIHLELLKLGVNSIMKTPLRIIFSFSKVDILHYIGGPTIKTLLICIVAKWKNPDLIVIVSFVNPIWSKINNQIIKLLNPDLILVSSEKWKNWAEEVNLKYKLINISGVDRNKFSNINRGDKSIRKKLNLPLNKIIYLHVGHLKYGRNLSVLEKLQQYDNIQCVVIGSTTTIVNKPLVDRLKENNVYVINKYIESIDEYYKACDCYIFPTIDERSAVQVPLSILEAISVGAPVVSNNFGGIKIFINKIPLLKIVNMEKIDIYDLNVTIEEHIKQCKTIGIHDNISQFEWCAIGHNIYQLYNKLNKTG